MVSGSISWSATDIASGYTKGSTTLTLASSTLAAVGCYLCIDQLNKGALSIWRLQLVLPPKRRESQHVANCEGHSGQRQYCHHLTAVVLHIRSCLLAQAARIQSDLNSMVQYSRGRPLRERRTPYSVNFHAELCVNCWVKTLRAITRRAITFACNALMVVSSATVIFITAIPDIRRRRRPWLRFDPDVPKL